MSSPKLNTSLRSPLSDLPSHIQDEIAHIEKLVRKECRERMLYSYGEVRSWLIFGEDPVGQLAMALNGATEDDWMAYILERQEAGAPVPESTGRTRLAAYEMPRRWAGLLNFIQHKILPPDADVAEWPGFVPLANSMADSVANSLAESTE